MIICKSEYKIINILEGENMQVERLFKQLKEAVSPFMCVRTSEERLIDNGFEKLSYDSEWNICRGGKYYINHHDTTLFAFTVGEEYKTLDMLRIAAAHTDYPCLRIKPNPDFKTDAYAQINLEVYGGAILNTWFDRPLGVAGRVALRGDNIFEPKMVMYQSKKPIMIIPNLAIHLNREVNKGVEINNQVDLMPIIDCLSEEEKTTDYFVSFIANELGVSKENILDFELNTFCMEEPSMVGISDSIISAPRIDNQISCFSLLEAIINGQRKEGVNLIALFDHEEIGSVSKQGAASVLLHDIIRRIYRNLGENEESIDRTVYNAMLLSVDVAHALHPNKVSKMDITNKPVMGKGVCIKEACSQSYATDSEAVAIVCQICEEKKIPYQRFANRSDIRGGGTLGSITSTLLPIKTVDIGVPILSMHSVREHMGTNDVKSLVEIVTSFFYI